MKIISNFKNNVIPDIYGANEGQQLEGINQRSFPFVVTEIPSDAKCLAFSLLDYDTDTIVGFPWIHWSAADIPVDSNEVMISDNFSLETNVPQGMNSHASILQSIRVPDWYEKNIKTDLVKKYAGPRPKSGIHNYRLQVFAFADKLNLKDGFYLSELMAKVDELSIAEVGMNLKYEKKI